jgi:hypothetical protein
MVLLAVCTAFLSLDWTDCIARTSNRKLTFGMAGTFEGKCGILVLRADMLLQACGTSLFSEPLIGEQYNDMTVVCCTTKGLVRLNRVGQRYLYV